MNNAPLAIALSIVVIFFSIATPAIAVKRVFLQPANALQPIPIYVRPNISGNVNASLHSIIDSTSGSAPAPGLSQTNRSNSGVNTGAQDMQTNTAGSGTPYASLAIIVAGTGALTALFLHKRTNGTVRGLL